MTEVPQPTKIARDVVDMTLAVAGSVYPVFGILKAGADIAIRKRIENSHKQLLEEIERRGPIAMDSEKWAYLVPAAYRFFEQVRIAEYEHVLQVLAKLIAGQLHGEPDDMDPAFIGRAAKKLEMMTLAELRCLAKCYRAFSEAEKSAEVGKQVFIRVTDLEKLYGLNSESQIERQRLFELLQELYSRGLLLFDPNSDFFGGSFHKTAYFAEIIEAVLEVEASL